VAANTMATTPQINRTLIPHRSDARLAELIAKRIIPGYEPSSILDVGCGDGVVSKHLNQSCRYQGLDIVDACIYEQSHDNPSVKYVQSEAIESFMTAEGPWDMILLLDVIEHTRGFTTLFDLAIKKANRHVVVSLPNELFWIDRLRMLKGHELNAHSLDLVGQPEGFKHQFLVNIAKARQLLSKHANRSGFTLKDEYLRPLTAKQPLQQPILWMLRQLGSDQAWSMGSIFVFEKMA
jgi:2-polyprenyl-3-methyl-5-hydroxy-6-metoxy-1,4-benzoquinol methylase